MTWVSKEYEIYIFETSLNFELYLWENWELIYLSLDKLISNMSLKPSIRTSQSFESKSDWLGFGRMVWSKKNNEKWTQKYRTEEYKNEIIQFFNTEIWAPDWNWVLKNKKAPDLLIKVEKECFFIAILNEKAILFPNEIESCIKELETTIRDYKLTKGKRSWAEQIYENSYSNGLSDAYGTSLAKQIDR